MVKFNWDAPGAQLQSSNHSNSSHSSSSSTSNDSSESAFVLSRKPDNEAVSKPPVATPRKFSTQRGSSSSFTNMPQKTQNTAKTAGPAKAKQRKQTVSSSDINQWAATYGKMLKHQHFKTCQECREAGCDPWTRMTRTKLGMPVPHEESIVEVDMTVMDLDKELCD